MANNLVSYVDPDGRFPIPLVGALMGKSIAGTIYMGGMTVTASALTASVLTTGVLVKGAALMAGKFAAATAVSSFASGIGGAGCCPGMGTYQSPYSSLQVEGQAPSGNVSYYGGAPQPFTPMAPVSPVSSQNINALEGLQLAGDIASFIPGVNTIGGLTSAGASLAMGNYGAAAFAAATAIPVAGVALKVGKAALAGVKAARAAKTNNLWKVGAYNKLRGLEAGLDAHHVGQKTLMKDFALDYNLNTGPSILVPKVGHTIRGPRGIVSRSTKGITNARELLARDIFELRRVYPNVPNSSLQELIRLNRTMYPGAFLK